MSDLIKALAVIQQKLKAPKGQYNKFGKYAYRNCEDILEALKPHLGQLSLTLTDDIQMVGDRIYVKSTVTLSDGSQSAEATGWAREALTKKGMDESQITGAASSYARKYALNGLFLTDDNKDADYDAGDNSAAPKREAVGGPAPLNENDKAWISIVKADPSRLSELVDVNQRAFIKQQAGV